LENVILDIFFVATVFEHLCHACHTTHPTSQRSTNIGRMHVLIQLVWICNAGRVQGFGGTYQSPQRCTISLSNDVVRDTITTSIPSRRDLTCDGTTEFEGFGDEDNGTLLQFSEPLTALASPDVTLFSVLQFKLLGFCLRNLNRLKIMQKLDFLIEDLFVGIVAAEKIRFCKTIMSSLARKG
jgi:hypothetical protein